MKAASLALAYALAAMIGCSAPAVAQSRDQTGAAPRSQLTPRDQGDATVGSGNAEERGVWRGDEDAAPAGRDDDAARRQLNERGAMMMRMRPMMAQRQMLLRGTGARFHFARGNARMDVTCSPQEDTEACVRAAGELIDKLAELHGANRDNMTGSAGRGGERSGAGAQSEDQDENGAPGERM